MTNYLNLDLGLELEELPFDEHLVELYSEM